MLNVEGYNINFDGSSKMLEEDIASFFATHYVGDSLNLTIRCDNISLAKENIETWTQDFIGFVNHIFEDPSFNKNIE